MKVNTKQMYKTVDWFVNCQDKDKQDKFRELCKENKAFKFVKRRFWFGEKMIPTAETLELMQSN